MNMSRWLLCQRCSNKYDYGNEPFMPQWDTNQGLGGMAVILVMKCSPWSWYGASHAYEEMSATPMIRSLSRPCVPIKPMTRKQSWSWWVASYAHDELAVMTMMRCQSCPWWGSNHDLNEEPIMPMLRYPLRGASHAFGDTNDEVVIMPIIMWYSCSW